MLPPLENFNNLPLDFKRDKNQIFEVYIIDTPVYGLGSSYLAGRGTFQVIVRELEVSTYPISYTKHVYIYEHGKATKNLIECETAFGYLITILLQSSMLESTKINGKRWQFKVKPEVFEMVKSKMGIES